MFTSESPPAFSAEDSPFLLRLPDLLDAFTRDAEAARAARDSGIPRGPITGFRALDRQLGGALQPGLTVLHGQPGSGKSALALQIAATCGTPALYLTAEMGTLELFRRVVARATGTFLGRLRSGELTRDQMLTLARAAIDAAPLLAFADATQTFADPTWLEEATQKVRGELPHVLIVVDSVHSWADMSPTDEPEYERLNAAVATLRTLAGRLGCSILAIAERNRASMTSGGLSASASSRKFEYAAEAVLDLGREKDAVPDAAGEVKVTVTMAKNRHGSAGPHIPLRFCGALQRFQEA